MSGTCCLRGVSLEPTNTDPAQWCLSLFEEMAPKLVLYGRALGLSHGEGEDVVQDLFVQLLKREEAPQNPVHYCLRAYRNRALNYKKSLWRRISREWESIHWFEENSEDISPMEQEAMKSLRGLPVDQREVLVLKIWHGMTFGAIGEMLELSPNTVAGRYRYGLQKLRRALRTIDEDTLEFDGESGPIMGTPARVKRA